MNSTHKETPEGLPAHTSARSTPWSTHARWLVAGVLFGLYVLTRSRYHLWDPIAYVARVIDHPLLAERFLSTLYFHPHHLLYVPLGKLAHVLLVPFGLTTDPFLPLQLTSALAGAGTAWLIASLVARQAGRRSIANLAMLGLGLSGAFWGYSSEVEVMLPAIFCGTLCAWLLVRRSGTGGVVLAGIAGAAAALLHQIMALPVATTTLVLVVSASRSGRPRRDGWIFAAVAGGLAALTYLAVAVLHEGLRTPAEILTWLFAAGSRSHFEDSSVGSTVGTAWNAATDSLLHVAGRKGGAWNAGTLARVGMLSAIGLALAALVAGMRLLRAAGRLDPVALGLGLATLSIAAFITWFQAGVPDYWVYLAPLIWAAVALYLPLRLATSRVPLAIGVLWVAGLGASNFEAAIQPRLDPTRAPYGALLHFARAQFRAGDTLVAHAPALGRARIAIMFYCDVDVLAVPEADDAAAVEEFDEALRQSVKRAASGQARLFVEPSAHKRLSLAVPPGTTFKRVGKAPRVVFLAQLPESER